ncbi:MAG: hypothetical protein JWO69_1658 [Thermoleophilia bacterium]|jgi:hypothetical protein|nr:hypothetical protein [Thermoleophilia bacterium]
MHYARLDLDVIDQLIAAIGEQDRLGAPLRDSFGGASQAPNAATRSLANAMFAAIEGHLEGLELRDLLSLHSDAHTDMIALGLQVPDSRPMVTTLGPTLELEPLLDRPADRDLLIDVGAEICRVIDGLVPYVYAASIASDAAVDLDGLTGVTRPRMFVFPADYQRQPAMIVHTEDVNMTEWMWADLFRRLIENLTSEEEPPLWDGAIGDGLSIADTSGSSSFRAAIQLPDEVDQGEAIEALVAFAPEVDWVVQAHDSSDRYRFAEQGKLEIEWREVAAADDDIAYRYEWEITTDVEPDDLAEAIDQISLAVESIAGT